MTTLLDLPQVTQCSVDGCSYNHDGCHAAAVTIGGERSHASCATFIPLDHKGGLARVESHVGACQREECVHNESLECSAPSIHVGGATGAECLTYAVA